MFEDLDLAELGLELPDDKVSALKEALAAKGQAALDQAVTGLKTKNSELLGTIKTTKTELDALKGQFEGVDIDQLKAIAKQSSQSEEAKLIAEGKLDEVINKRTERLRGDYDKQLLTEKARAERAESFANRFRDKVLADSIRSAAIKTGALPEASEDIILRARGTFRLNEEGEAVAVDADGEVIYGKDGKTPLTPLEWAESLRENAPHLWPKATGAGPTGDRGAKGANKTMTRAAFEALPEADKAKVATGGYTITD